MRTLVSSVLRVTMAASIFSLASGCREGSRRDTVVVPSSATPAPSASSSAPAPATSEAASDAAATDAAVVASDAALPANTVAYGPATLTGKLTEETFFGPPGYGSDPAHDKKELVLVLGLAQPIDVVLLPDAGSELDVERMGVAKVSLTDPKDAGTDLHKFVGQRITVKGTLFGAHTAHHHTDVLMSGVEVVPQ